MSQRVILTTVFSSFNYGSSLQALAGKLIIQNVGYEEELVRMKSLVKGRDIRLKKIATIILRSLFLKKGNSFKAYESSYQKTLVDGTKRLFFDFTDEYLKPRDVSWLGLKHMAKDAFACFSGSDQIWNSSTLYVDPLYYLRFAPEYKRVALSPSFGRDYVAEYNWKKMAKWIGEYPCLSVREDSGVKLIKDMTGKDALHLLDPTLIISAQEWKRVLSIKDSDKNCILAYFLDRPSSLARESLAMLKRQLDCEVVAIPYLFDDMEYCDSFMAAGPKEFVQLVANAKVVCTDSFHGTAFAINMHTPFYTFEREYGCAGKQSERVLSILRKVGMLDRYQPDSVEKIDSLDFGHSDTILNEEREKAYGYVKNAINSIKKHEE